MMFFFFFTTSNANRLNPPRRDPHPCCPTGTLQVQRRQHRTRCDNF
jgi:hypothetical protein